MKPHSVVADSDEASVVSPETNANRAGSSSCEHVLNAGTSPAQGTPHRGDEPGEADKRLAIERGESEPAQAGAAANRRAARIGARSKRSADTTAARERKQAKDVWPLTLDEIIEQTLVRLLHETAGNRRRTASLLGISRSTLYRMLERYGIGDVGRGAMSRKSRRDPSVPPTSTT
jgi:Bacterial regulatory protein, Fis family